MNSYKYPPSNPQIPHYDSYQPKRPKISQANPYTAQKITNKREPPSKFKEYFADENMPKTLNNRYSTNKIRRKRAAEAMRKNQEKPKANPDDFFHIEDFSMSDINEDYLNDAPQFNTSQIAANIYPDNKP